MLPAFRGGIHEFLAPVIVVRSGSSLGGVDQLKGGVIVIAVRFSVLVVVSRAIVVVVVVVVVITAVITIVLLLLLMMMMMLIGIDEISGPSQTIGTSKGCVG